MDDPAYQAGEAAGRAVGMWYADHLLLIFGLTAIGIAFLIVESIRRRSRR